MRIDCQSCGAAYAIDDNLIGDRGVRAQCPRCGAQRVVKKPAPGELAPAAPPAFGGGAMPGPAPVNSDPFAQTAAPGAFGGAPPPPANPFEQTAAPSPFGGPPSASPFGAPPGGGFGGAPAPSPFGGAAPNPFGGGAPAPSPFGPPPGTPAFGTPAFGTPAAAPNPFGGAGAAPPAFGAPSAPPPNPFAGAAANPFAPPPGPPPAGRGAPNPFEGGSALEALGGQRGGGDPFSSTQGPTPGADPFGGPPPAAPKGPALPSGNPFSFTAPVPAPPAPSAPPPRADDPFGGTGAAPDPFGELGGNDAAPRGGGTGGGSGSKDAREWRVRLPDGTVLGPLTLDEVRQRVKAGEITKDAQAAQGNGSFRVITGYAPLAVVFRGPAEKNTQKVVYRQSGGGGRIGAVMAVVLLLGAAGGGVFVFKDKISGPPQVEYENIFARRAQLWRLQFPDLGGTAEEHLAKGLKFYKEDTALGYRMADDEFLKALCLDADNLEAIGAYVENYALLPPRRNDVETTKDALDGIEYGIKKNPRKARLFRAQGALLLKMGRVELAQAALAQALRLDPDDAGSKLFMAQSNLDRNVVEAIKLTEDASRKDPELLRANYVLGQAYQKQGRFKTALNQFNQRLSRDKEHRETLLGIARLYVEVGDFQHAVQHLEHLLQVDNKNIAARLMLAKVLYQGLKDFRKAEGQLQDLVNVMGTEGAEMAREVYTHQAFVLGERGKWKEAEEAVNAALRDDPAYGPALYVAGRVLHHRGAAAEAREKLEKAAQQVQNTYLEAPVRTALADVLHAQGLLQDSIRAYTSVMRSDARYVRAYLGLASLYAEVNNMQQAAAMMREVLDIDPFYRSDHFYFTDYPETPRDTEAYRPAWSKVKPGENDKSIVLSSEGITAFHSEQLDEAETQLRRALGDDHNNLAAQVYLGAVQLQKRKAKDALTSLLAATRLAPNHVRAGYLLGRAWAATDQAEKADRKFQDVHEADGNFVAAINALGEMALKRGEDEKARDLFLEAFRADADYTPAKTNLLKCGY